MDHLPTVNLSDLTRLAIVQALRETGGNRMQAARRLDIDIRTLQRKLRLLGLQDRHAKGAK